MLQSPHGQALVVGDITSMKKCPYCGKEYGDDATYCAMDQSPLDPSGKSAQTEDPPEAGVDQSIVQPSEGESVSEESGAPEGYRCMGSFDPFDADRLLKKFEAADIRFQIDRVERQVSGGRGGIRRIGLIEIYVHLEDDERAGAIFQADIKL